jgi:hypothetical protein
VCVRRRWGTLLISIGVVSAIIVTVVTILAARRRAAEAAAAAVEAEIGVCTAC